MSKAASLAGFATAITPPSDLVVGIVTASNVSVANSITATTFYGSGANLTGIAATANISADTLVVAGVTTVSAGSTSAPSLAPSGDSNTGIFFPSADTIAFGEGGAEAARIDSSGRLLLGTPSTSSSALLQVQGNSSSSTGDAIIQLRVGKNNVGILNGNSLGSIQFSNTESTVSAVIEAVADANWNTTNDYPSRLVFSTTADAGSSPVERMRIDNSGRFLVGKTSNNITNEYALFGKGFGPNSNSTAFSEQITPLSVYGDFGSGSNDQIASCALTVYGWSSLASNSGAIMRGWWSTNGPSLGTPTLRYQVNNNGNVTNSNNSYGSLSDIRYKQDITLAGSQWEDIKNISVKKFRFIDDVKNETEEKPAQYFLGCIAQEVAEVSPGLVEVRGDDKDEDGNVIPEVLTLKYSVLYMKAIKALQEAQERIETLEAQNTTQASAIEALTARLDAAGL